MCLTNHYRSSACGHEWLELSHPCGARMNLLTCPDFGTVQPFGNARRPRRRYLATYKCPACAGREHDMRRERMIITKRSGYKIGLGPAKRDVGVDVYPQGAVGCCVVM